MSERRGIENIRPKDSAWAHSEAGFTLLEMLVVLAIICILMLASLPPTGAKIDQARIAESIKLVGGYQSQVESYYATNKEFPLDNDALEMPMAEKVVGNYLSAVYLVDGALHLELGNKISANLNGKILSIRPIFIPAVENAPVSWICGNDTVPATMIAAGENRTNVEASSLPITCR